MIFYSNETTASRLDRVAATASIFYTTSGFVDKLAYSTMEIIIKKSSHQTQLSTHGIGSP